MRKKVTALVTATACLSATGLMVANQAAQAGNEQPSATSTTDEKPAMAEKPAKPGQDKPAGQGGEGSHDGQARSGTLDWEKCADMDVGVDTLQCADISVPADWKRPHSRQTSIGVAKLPAQSTEQRLGSLVVNTGGPSPMIPGLANESSREQLQELTKWFDVIAFDPRGLGTSSGVSCPASPKYVKLLLHPDRKTWQDFTTDRRVWESACLDKAGALAGNLDAWQVAHDVEALRKALGEGGLNYFGNSYGTVYAQAYTELFPTNVDRMFLDSTFDHSQTSPLGLMKPGADLADDKFRRFGQWCENNDECALNPENARAVWDELLERAEREPLPAPDAGPDKSVGPDRLRFATVSSVVRPARWQQFSESLAKARSGDASDLYVGAEDIAPMTSPDHIAYCSDFPFEHGWAGMTAMEQKLRETAPRVGWLLARTHFGRCAGLQQQGSFPPHRIDPDGLAPVLLVSGSEDHTTPPVQGRAVSEQLPGSVWFGADSDHAVYLGGNRCVRAIAHRYLRTGELPEQGDVCPANGQAE